MESNGTSWSVLTQDPIIVRREYSFGPGMANATAVAIGDGRLLLISPPTAVEPEVLEELREYGEVVAILEPNGVHHMGLELCHEIYPYAVAYVTEVAGRRIAKKEKNPGAFEPIENLRDLVGDKLDVLEVPGNKVGDVIVRAKTEKGMAWWFGDFIGNGPLPNNWLIKALIKWTKSGPGFMVNRIFFKLFVADRIKARDWFLDELKTTPVDLFIPAHGEPIQRAGLAEELTQMLAEAM